MQNDVYQKHKKFEKFHKKLFEKNVNMVKYKKINN